MSLSGGESRSGEHDVSTLGSSPLENRVDAGNKNKIKAANARDPNLNVRYNNSLPSMPIDNNIGGQLPSMPIDNRASNPKGKSPTTSSNPDENMRFNSLPSMPIESRTAQVVPGTADRNDPAQINVTDYAAQTSSDPTLQMRKDDRSTSQNESTFLQDHVERIDKQSGGTVIDRNRRTYQNDDIETDVEQGRVSQGQDPEQLEANSYRVDKMDPNGARMRGARGRISENSLVDADELAVDTEAIAEGETGLGRALNQSAQQGMQVLNTSNPLESAAAASLGPQGYIDSQATVQGQLESLSKQFTDADGNPKIPSWAAGTARNISKIASFSGMTGSAATAAMSQALMEASIPIASQDAQFFQTVTLKNLDNAQQSTINKANVLARLEEVNLDSRTAAAVTNSQRFLQMDMANLDNEQQANVINTQNRFQSLLENSKQENAKRLFEAESQNDMDKYYSQLSQQMEQFNASQSNAMSQFNASETNSMSKFNSEMENSRDQFYSNMQYNIDVSNAKWRQEITMTENQQSFEAAAMDVNNMLGISQESLNQIWDRSDALLDYVWKSGENESERNNQIVLQKMAADANLDVQRFQADQQDSAAVGGIFGNLAGIAAGSFFDSFDWGGLF